MNWFKSLFSRKTPERVFPIVDMKVNISEPVLSFVETFKANPKRFKVKKLSVFNGSTSRTVYYILTDKHTNLAWQFSVKNYFGMSWSYCVDALSEYPSFLTKQEAEYIYQTMTPWFNSRKTLLKVRQDNKKREALRKVYCK